MVTTAVAADQSGNSTYNICHSRIYQIQCSWVFVKTSTLFFWCFGQSSRMKNAVLIML